MNEIANAENFKAGQNRIGQLLNFQVKSSPWITLQQAMIII